MIREIDALVQSRLRGSIQTEIAVVSEVSGTNARVKRQGQTVSTKFLPVASGVTVAVNDRVLLVRVNGDLNTAYIAGKVM